MTNPSDLQRLCERGQELLARMSYIDAEASLADAERLAQDLGDFDTLARLYMPLQEVRRQRRQRCGEGTACLDLLAESAVDQPDPSCVITRFPHGQLLVAGWGTVAPAVEVRRLQREKRQYAETILGAVYPIKAFSRPGPPAAAAERAIVLVPTPEVSLPDVALAPRDLEALRAVVPPYCPVLRESEIPFRGARPGDWQTYALVMSLWERLHAPFLAAADAGTDPLNRMDGYRRTINVDYACELAHQKLAAVAREYAREIGGSTH